MLFRRALSIKSCSLNQSRALSIKSSTVLLKERKESATNANFPDFVEHWGPVTFRNVGIGMTIGAASLMGVYGICQETLIVDIIVGSYLIIGYRDLNQKHHALLRNFPVLGNVRFLFESIRPEIRQYFIESDEGGSPFDRNHRSLVYQRAKSVVDTICFGTRRDVYATGYEFANHSMFPAVVDHKNSRVIIGGSNPKCKQPYSAALLNVSGMSYGALSDNAITGSSSSPLTLSSSSSLILTLTLSALSTGAKLGGFYHNTGEGGVSRFHIDGGGDLVWNIGTGYFGCRNKDGTFSPEQFQKTLKSCNQIKMIEIKLSQGAKPGHGGLLPGAKVTKFIAEARGVEQGVDCHSPPNHSTFSDSYGLLKFIEKLRELSDGKPIGFKLCVGRPEEFSSIVAAMVEQKTFPDFITVDGAEGGTGAAPAEFSNSVGMPLIEGLTFVNNILIGAGIRDKIKIICAGKVTSGFSIVRNLALGADLCNAARAMMFALGCIQALKCNTNKCPTGITTQDKDLMSGLDVDSKSIRVKTYQAKTVEYALDIIAAMGHSKPSDVMPTDIHRRVSPNEIKTLADLYVRPDVGSLLTGKAPIHLQNAWNAGLLLNHFYRNKKSTMSKDDIKNLIKKYGGTTNELIVENIFDNSDVDHDGTISRVEITNLAHRSI